MFNCGVCHKPSKPGESVTRIVVETRPAKYPARYAAHRNGQDDPGGTGTEIQREILACPRCV